MKTIAGASLACLILAGNAVARVPAPEAQPRAGRAAEEQPRPAGPAKSARFRLRVGRIALGLTCPDDEPLKVCSDFAMQLLDKATIMQKSERE